MEFAAAALSTLATAGAEIGSTIAAGASSISAAGSSIASAGSTLLSATGGASTWATILSGGATVASVLAMQNAGESKEFALNAQADDAELQAKVEQVQGLDRRQSLKAALVQAVGERDVADASSGVDISFGTPAQARREAIKDGERAIDLDQSTEDFRRQRLLERAGNYRIMASQARNGALGNAAALAIEGGAKILKRG